MRDFSSDLAVSAAENIMGFTASLLFLPGKC